MKRILLFALFFLQGCTATTTPLEGQWRAEGMVDDGFGWYLEYSFTGTEYYHAGYPPISEHGKFTILEEDAGRLHLELSPVDLDPYELFITVDPMSDEIEINGLIYSAVSKYPPAELVAF